MGKIFNIAGPCDSADHYMLPAMARLPNVMRLIEDKAYFVVHAQRQCGYVESYPHIVLQAFLQRVINGNAPKKLCFGGEVAEADRKGPRGEIIREMALGSGRLDLGVLFRGGKYAVEVKLKARFEKNREKAYDQVCRYMDHLGVPEGWLVVFDPDLAKPWDGKIDHEDIKRDGKWIHLFCC